MIGQQAIEATTGALLSRAQGTIEGLTEAIVFRECGQTASEPVPQLHEAQAAMVAKVQQMPSHLKLGMAGLTLGFSGYVRVRAGGGLSSLPVERRLALLDEWRVAPLGPCRQFVQFYEKMGTFLYYSLVEESLMPPVEVR